MEFPTPRLGERVIIAMKGLPCTGKLEIASRICEWARSSVFSIDDFLSTVTGSLEKGYSSQFMPSEEEAERLHRLAFDALCKSAYRYLCYSGWCVVIKSRLCTSFEVDRLVQLSREDDARATIIIVECHTKNEHRLCARLENKGKSVLEHEEWYKPRSRLDYEKARDDWLDSETCWDLHLRNVINADRLNSQTQVIRLVLDPFADLNLGNWYRIFNLIPAFRDAITYLFTMQHGTREEDWIGEEIIRDRYEVVQFDKLRRYLVEKELLRARKKSKYLCLTSRGGKCCVFKACTEEELLQQAVGNCGLCDKRVISAGYTCHCCILTLHKSCAELHGFAFPDLTSNFWLKFYPYYCDRYLTRTYACKSCMEGGIGFSDDCKSCRFQTHLKWRMFPTIINHDSHHHPLSLQVGEILEPIVCKSCDSVKYGSLNRGKYGCYVCGLYYCLTCVSRPGKVEHRHGGHEHVLKLLYSRDGMEPEEDYWCGVCYKDMDPQHWFYSCQDCPYYQAHANCIKPIR